MINSQGVIYPAIEVANAEDDDNDYNDDDDNGDDDDELGVHSN